MDARVCDVACLGELAGVVLGMHLSPGMTTNRNAQLAAARTIYARLRDRIHGPTGASHLTMDEDEYRRTHRAFSIAAARVEELTHGL